LLVPLERRRARYVLLRVPRWLETYHLTLLIPVMLAATEEIKVSFSRFGPTKLRIALIIINALLVRFGTRGLTGALPWMAGCGTVALVLLAYLAQKRLGQSDMLAKQADCK
jgi:hypothetical protein